MQRKDELDDSDGSVDGRNAIIDELLQIMARFDRELRQLLSMDVLRAADDLQNAIDTCQEQLESYRQDKVAQEASAAARCGAWCA